MSFKKNNLFFVGSLMISSFLGIHFNGVQYNQKSQSKSVKTIDWNTISIIGYDTNINNESVWNITITLGGFEPGTTAADVLAIINESQKLGISFKYNNEESIVGDFGDTSLNEDNITINGDDSATISLDIPLPQDIQIIYDINVSKDYNGSDWENWLPISSESLVNKINTNLISLDETKSVASDNIKSNQADIFIPIKYDDGQILAGDQSSLVIEKNLQNMTIKSNDEILENEMIEVDTSNTYLKAEVNNLEIEITLINLNPDTEYNNFKIDLDGDDATTDDMIDLTDFSIKTTIENNGLTPLEISSIVIMSLLIIGIFIFVLLIIYQNFLKKDS